MLTKHLFGNRWEEPKLASHTQWGMSCLSLLEPAQPPALMILRNLPGRRPGRYGVRLTWLNAIHRDSAGHKGHPLRASVSLLVKHQVASPEQSQPWRPETSPGTPRQVSHLQRVFPCVFWAGSICPAVCPASSHLESGGWVDGHTVMCQRQNQPRICRWKLMNVANLC